MSERSGVDYPDVVDVITHDPAKDEWKLIIVETGEWDGSPDRILKLQEKLNNYLSFVLDGQLHQLHPDSVGKRVVIQLDLYERPDSLTLDFIQRAKEPIKAEGVGFYLNVVPDHTLRA